VKAQLKKGEVDMPTRRLAPNITVGSHEGLWILDHADARPYYAARLCTVLAAVLIALAVWWLLV
jgi:hypothetical protein